MYGAIIGDMVGSIHEFLPIKQKDFPLFVQGSQPTDDSVMTIAVAEALLSSKDDTKTVLVEKMQDWGEDTPTPDMAVVLSTGYFPMILNPIIALEMGRQCACPP